MADPDNLLDVLQADMVGILQAAPALSNAYVFTGTEKDFATRLKKTFSTRTDSESGKRGLGIQVMPIFVTEAESNLPGPPLKLRCQILVIENVRLNRAAETGTLKTSSQTALNVLGALHHQSVGSHAFYAEKNPIVPEKAEDGFEAHVVTVFARANGMQGPGKPGAVTAEVIAGMGGVVIMESILVTGIVSPSGFNGILTKAPDYNGNAQWSTSGLSFGPTCDLSEGQVYLTKTDGTWQFLGMGPGQQPAAMFRITSADETPVGLTGWTEYIGTGDLAITAAGALIITGITDPEGSDPLRLEPAGFENGYQSWGVLNDWRLSFANGTWNLFNGTLYNATSEDVQSLPIGLSWFVDVGAGDPVIVQETEDPGQFLQLTCPNSGDFLFNTVDIYYTTDGSYPAPANAEATLYTAPFELPEAGTVVRAAAYATGMNPGDCIEILITP